MPVNPEDAPLREADPAALVRLARRLARLTQAQLAQAAGVRQAQVSAFETGRRTPTFDQLRSLVEAAGYALDLGLARPDPGGRRLVGPLGAVLVERLDQVLGVLREHGLDGRVWVVGDVARGEETAYQSFELVAEGVAAGGSHQAATAELSLYLPRPVQLTGTHAWAARDGAGDGAQDGAVRVPAEAVELTATRHGQRVAVVTGASRAQGIGAAVVRRLAADGLAVLVHGWEPHDAEQPWGADEGGAARLVAELTAQGRPVALVEADLADPQAPEQVLQQAVDTFGRVDVLVANHARSSEGGLAEATATELDRSFAVNARSTVLLVRAFAERVPSDPHAGRDVGGRVVLFTSGQYHGGMPGELAYVASKGAVHQVTATLAVELAPRAITVNCVDPGPTDTGWAGDEVHAWVRQATPAGRWGTPDDAARLVSWLAGPDSGWVTGQVIASDGGWSSR